jgi:hypothetical protein
MLSQFVPTMAKPKAKTYRLTDGDGLSLQIEPIVEFFVSLYSAFTSQCLPLNA